ncbi:16919_t:CDS:2, partial [Dentiscutata heterogama]
QIISNNERILVFTTTENIRYLSRALYWIMDGTFQTVPTIFYQLYTIYAPVESADNFKIFPLVNSLMTNKTAEQYKLLFEILINFAEENGIELAPTRIITDFESAVINMSRYMFPGVINKSCFFHLSQNGWRRIQKYGLAGQYGCDECFSIKIRCLFALAFLPAQEIPEAFEFLKPLIPSKAKQLVKWFEETYVLGKVRSEIESDYIIRSAPLFSPQLWSVHDSVDTGVPRTQNVVEEMQKEQQNIEAQIERIIRGEQVKQKKRLAKKEKRITTIVNNQNNLSLIEFLTRIAHNLSI